MKTLKDFPLGTIFYFHHSYSKYCLLDYRDKNSFYLALLKPDGEIFINEECYLQDSYIEEKDFKVVGYTKIITI